MQVLGFTTSFDFDQEAAALPRESGRWRWVVAPDETRCVFSVEEATPHKLCALSISEVRLGSQNWDARFKTRSYLSHYQARRTASTPEAILLNEHGHVASCANANIFWRKGSKLFTPSHESGCRQGITRRFVKELHSVQAGEFPLAELLAADEIFFTNSMRGIVSINALEDRTFTDFSCAGPLRVEYEKEVARQTGAAITP